MSFVMCTIYMADAGMGQSLVRTPASERTTWSSAFWMISGFGGLLSLALVGISFAAPLVFGEPRLQGLLLGLAVVPLIVSAIAAPTADLQQRQKFRELAGIEGVSALTGLGVAITLAFQGAGAWALVMQQVAFWVMKAALIDMDLAISVYLDTSERERRDIRDRSQTAGKPARPGVRWTNRPCSNHAKRTITHGTLMRVIFARRSNVAPPRARPREPPRPRAPPRSCARTGDRAPARPEKPTEPPNDPRDAREANPARAGPRFRTAPPGGRARGSRHRPRRRPSASKTPAAGGTSPDEPSAN
jgi:hypothetical protein